MIKYYKPIHATPDGEHIVLIEDDDGLFVTRADHSALWKAAKNWLEMDRINTACLISRGLEICENCPEMDKCTTTETCFETLLHLNEVVEEQAMKEGEE
ncbi:hypothetical protein ES703_81584 [subsurface metagenome]